MYKFLQIDLNWSRAAIQFMYATTCENETDILIISEPPKVTYTGAGWITSQNQYCAIVSMATAKIITTNSGTDHGYVWTKFGIIIVFNYNCSPNCTPYVYEGFLDNLEQKMWVQFRRNINFIIASNLNFRMRPKCVGPLRIIIFANLPRRKKSE